MVTEFKNVPCVIKHNDVLYKVERPKKFFNRHREMTNESVEFYYIDETISGMQAVAQALQKIEDSLKGIIRNPKETYAQEHYKYEYRLNQNTVLCAHNLDDFNRLKKWHNVN